MTEHFLHISNLSAAHQQHDVLSGIELTLERGKHLVLIGASGSGKTTLLRCIAGLHAINHGTIQVNGVILASDNEQLAPEKREVGFVFQDHALFPHLSARENIEFASKLNEKDVSEVIELLQLNELLNHYPHQLSGGQQQRVALARSLCYNSRLILLDEPFASLDESLRKSIIPRLCQWFKSRKTTVISVAHDQSDAFAIADELAYLEEGQLIQKASPATLYNAPKTRSVAEFMSSGTWLDLDALRQVPTMAERIPQQTVSGAFLRRQALEKDDHGLIAGTIIERRFMQGHYVCRVKLVNSAIELEVIVTKSVEIGAQIKLTLATLDQVQFF